MRQVYYLPLVSQKGKEVSDSTHGNAMKKNKTDKVTTTRSGDEIQKENTQLGEKHQYHPTIGLQAQQQLGRSPDHPHSTLLLPPPLRLLLPPLPPAGQSAGQGVYV